MRLLSSLLLAALLLPTIAAAEAKNEKKDAQFPFTEVSLGDPKELFLKKPPPVKDDPDAPKKRARPSSLDDLWHNLKADFSHIGKDIEKATNELSTLKKHTFDDPDFTPPPRPDWR